MWLLLPRETAFISAVSCRVGGLQLFSLISPLSLLNMAFQVDRKADKRASYLSQKCPKLDAP